ncbi:MAG: MATE family efflux transporter [Myxococcota bacterium]|nr:MATE family efflux transporter [Myxococcota bacterium]
MAEPLPSLGAETRRLLRLALPVVGSQLATMLMGFVDTVMVGRVSVEALAAAAVANVWVFGTSMFAHGILFGLDPLVSQAHGARDNEAVGVWLKRGIWMSALLSVPLIALWLGAGRVMALSGQSAEVAEAAHRYILFQIPSIPFLLGYVALRQVLQARELVRPALVVILIANVFNALFNWVLIFGNLGFPALGLDGAGIATSLTRALTLIGLVLFVWRYRLLADVWRPFERADLSFGGAWALLVVGTPIAVQMCLEMWAFGGSAFIAGRLGAEALAAHTVAMNLASITFMVPLGLAQAAAIRVGNLLGGGDPAHAQRAAWVAVSLGAAVMTLSAAIFWLGRTWLPRIYTPDPGVVALAATILPIAAAFQVFDGTQAVSCGVLRGMGRTRPAAVFNLIGYWILALPIGGWLALRGGAGLSGLWWGLCFGLAGVAAALVVWIARRGPARMAPGTAP